VDKLPFLRYYANQNMSNRIVRKIYFWVLFSAFFAVIVPIIFYSMGYRFSFKRGVFVYTGSISIKSNPQTIDVVIDGKPNTSKQTSRLNNSYHIGSIDPGEHLVEIKGQSFQSWSKKIVVNSGTATEFWNVLLARNSYDRTDFSVKNIQKFFLKSDNKLAACVVFENEQFIVRILDLGNLSSDDIYSSSDYQFTNDKKENIEWSHQGDKVIVPVLKNNEKNYFIIDVKTKDLIDLKQLIGADNIKKVRWDPQNKDYFYYISDGSLFRMNTAGDQKETIATQIASYDLSGSSVYYFQLPQGMVYKVDPNSFSSPSQITTAAPKEMDDASYKIIVYDNNRIAMLNESGKLYIYNQGESGNYFEKLSDNAKEIQFSDDGKKLLYWNDWEVFVYFTRKWDVQPQREENEKQDIIRFSAQIGNVQWAKDYEHVIFSADAQVKIVELDDRGKRNIQNITEVSNVQNQANGDFVNNKIFFIDNNSDGISNFYSINFPEAEGILGFGGS
jgi:hypothetical protein